MISTKTSRNDLFEQKLNGAWVPAFSHNRRRQVKRKQLAIDLRMTAALGAARAAESFPNDTGNYCFKRTPKPTPAPLSEQQRFAKLVVYYADRGGRRVSDLGRRIAAGTNHLFRHLYYARERDGAVGLGVVEDLVDAGPVTSPRGVV